ncbi:MAG: sigma-54-dependent transcriptional regulator [Planctomycetota bacterium]|jgi:DNA-binding NtrC family response regulator
MAERPRVMIVDDEPLMLESMEGALVDKGYDVRTFAGGASAIQAVQKDAADILIVDLRMPEMDGLALLGAVKEIDQDLPVIIMTAYSTVTTAVEAMKAGAYDYVQKPFDIDELDLLVRRALEDRRLRRRQDYLTRSQEEELNEREIIGQSEEIAYVREMIEKVASSPCTVLVQGDSGTGKELVARHIHRTSPRRSEIFVPVNAAAISEPLLESELFGHARGAFTGADKARKGLFEAADGGTLFLDEVSETSAPVQAKLLRAIEEKEIRPVGSSHPIRVDVRLIASTNADLAEAVKEGRFREDLYYRLNVFPMTVPPLRERKEDIPLLAEHFLRRACRSLRKEVSSMSEEVLGVLMAYSWPGNVRELENVIERAVIVEDGPEITRSSLSLNGLPGIASGSAGVLDDLTGKPLHDARNAFEKLYIETRLSRALRTGTITELADELGVHRTTLYELFRRHGITAAEARRRPARKPKSAGAPAARRNGGPGSPK